MFSADDFWQYFGVFSALVLSAIGVPIPEELPIATGGVLVSRTWDNPETGIHWWVMLPLCIIGVVVCDALLYLIGRKWGVWLIQRAWVQRRILPPAKREKIEKNFHKYGIGILLVARLLPGIRGPVFITAGMIRLPFTKFLLADALYAIPGVNAIFWLAFWFADSFLSLLNKLEDYRHLIVVAALAYISGFVTNALIQRRTSTGDPTDIPVIGKQVASLSLQLHHEGKSTSEESIPPPGAPTAVMNGPLQNSSGRDPASPVAKQ